MHIVLRAAQFMHVWFTGATMPKLIHIVPSTAFVAVVLAFSTPSFAQRPISGAEAQRLLTGKQFMIQCVDGTQGYGVFNNHGIVTVAYRRFSTRNDAPDLRDRATVRARGNEICLAWKEFDGGGDGCYPVSEKNVGHYRIGSAMRWCEIKARPGHQAAQ
jgi:hypothetical protein